MDERRSNTFHEAGHAIAALALGRQIERITLLPPAVFFLPIEFDPIPHAVARTVAGPTAEAIHRGNPKVRFLDGKLGGAISDRQVAQQIACVAYPDDTDQQAAFLRRVSSDVFDFIERPEIWEAVERIAHDLTSADAMSGERAAELWKEYPAANKLAKTFPRTWDGIE